MYMSIHSLSFLSFFSTLLTAVLSHHLAWVYTVSRTNDTRHSRNSKSVSCVYIVHMHMYMYIYVNMYM